MYACKRRVLVITSFVILHSLFLTNGEALYDILIVCVFISQKQVHVNCIRMGDQDRGCTILSKLHITQLNKQSIITQPIVCVAF